jgi:hypothetical protein
MRWPVNVQPRQDIHDPVPFQERALSKLDLATTVRVDQESYSSIERLQGKGQPLACWGHTELDTGGLGQPLGHRAKGISLGL